MVVDREGAKDKKATYDKHMGANRTSKSFLKSALRTSIVARVNLMLSTSKFYTEAPVHISSSLPPIQLTEGAVEDGPRATHMG